MDHDVVVAGAGPVGLMLACELRLGGASVLVLERNEDTPPARYGSMGARAVNEPSVHLLYLRGLLSAVEKAAVMWIGAIPEMPPGEPGERPDIYVGHFAGIGIRVDRLKPPGPGEEFLGAGVISQADLEAILAARAAELGVEVRRGVALTGFEADADGVTVQAGGAIRAAWLVGADGGRSTVRGLAGIDFPGVDPVFTGRQAVVDLADPEKLIAGDWQHGENGAYTLGGWADGSSPRVHTVEYEPPADRDAPVTAEEMQASLRRVSGTDVTVTRVHVATRYADTTRQATTYRRGRVLLCGDAAHVHSPAGGQGMNLGLGDAANLGWKLALVARGVAPDSLLDTYTAERHPIGAWVQKWSMAQTALSTARGPRADALREVMADLLDTSDGATHVVSMIGGGWQHYDLPGDHPLVGRRVPDLPLDDGTTMAGSFRDGRAVLLDVDSGAAEIAAPWGDRVRVVTARPVAFPDQPMAALVRPDGHIAWVGIDGLHAALTTWLGPPAGEMSDS